MSWYKAASTDNHDFEPPSHRAGDSWAWPSQEKAASKLLVCYHPFRELRETPDCTYDLYGHDLLGASQMKLGWMVTLPKTISLPLKMDGFTRWKKSYWEGKEGLFSGYNASFREGNLKCFVYPPKNWGIRRCLDAPLVGDPIVILIAHLGKSIQGIRSVYRFIYDIYIYTL